MPTKPTVEDLQLQYQDYSSKAERLRTALVEQVNRLVDANGLTLGVPIESRLKTWSSLEEKLSRKSLELNQITDLNDLVGVRIILLFKKDLIQVGKLLEETFTVSSKEDTGSRLDDGQFGYQSQHYILSIPEAWSKIPTFADLQGLKVEVQIRTLAQHIWAAASHKLQYKQEESVPPPLRRAIYRASALLETVDLEFERVLEERQTYINASTNKVIPDEHLNVDLLSTTLEKWFPAQNRTGHEQYGELLVDLMHFGITTMEKLQKLLEKQTPTVLKADQEKAANRLKDQSISDRMRERLEKGMFWSHTGLARRALILEFGAPAWDLYQKERDDPQPSKSTAVRKPRTAVKPLPPQEPKSKPAPRRRVAKKPQ
ncbi:GTP pyrophosphokinase family protein [Massilia sp. BSC265]|uniref:GTP pyrophosphokinase n=1 Tax=Massilia sp. BSC265 TaxID=1549812 RepID=UPI0009DF85FE|nr:hypothetical protein [Massilia sp. BSC265]